MNLKRSSLMLLGFILLGLYLFTNHPQVQANSSNFNEEKIKIEREDTVLNGTILMPEKTANRAGIVLVHGAGAHDQNSYRKLAEVFAEAGVATLIYGKRTVGYSAWGVGKDSRSYSLLANDALAAAEVLRSQEEIDVNRVGLWGESEGASVTLLAASRSPDVAYVITVGANGVTPIQQTSWHLENNLRYQGVTAQSFIEAVTRKGLRFALSAEMFAEATFQINPVLEQVQQPILAMWGQYDRNSPPVESAQIFIETLKHSGNTNYIVQFIPAADHTLRPSPHGFEQLNGALAPGFIEGMVNWVNHTVSGEALGPTVIGQTPLQATTSDVAVNEPTLFDSAWLNLAFIITLIVLFVSYVSMSVTMKISKQPPQSLNSSSRWLMRALSAMAPLTVIGLYAYIMYVSVTHEVSFIVFGRPLVWLLLEMFAWIVFFLTLILAIRWWQNRTVIPKKEKFRAIALLIGGILFILWASHWELLF